jgi:hypothetical protein
LTRCGCLGANSRGLGQEVAGFSPPSTLAITALGRPIPGMVKDQHLTIFGFEQRYACRERSQQSDSEPLYPSPSDGAGGPPEVHIHSDDLYDDRILSTHLDSTTCRLCNYLLFLCIMHRAICQLPSMLEGIIVAHIDATKKQRGILRTVR